MTNWTSTLHDWLWEVTAYLQTGGALMLPLLGVSLWMWFLIAKKFSEIQLYKREKLSLAQCLAYLEDEVAELPSGWQTTMMLEFRNNQTGEPQTDRKLLREIAEQHLQNLEKHILTIIVLASAAPLLGLLGTVSGMITTFDVIARYGTGNAKALASGISEALITTQSGLIVAIPGLFMGNFLRRRAERFRARIERFCLNFSRIYRARRQPSPLAAHFSIPDSSPMTDEQ
jgi:biopolymer transport protein ExbB